MNVNVDEKIVDQLVQELKTKTLDMAFLYNNENSLFEMATCPTFSLNPDNPIWINEVRQYVVKHYQELIDGNDHDYESVGKNFIEKILTED
jgi:hypothetical protein